LSFEPTPFMATGTTQSILVYLGVFVQLFVREPLVLVDHECRWSYGYSKRN
jgi:hypothetical protein